jgi:hypothetical protein
LAVTARIILILLALACWLPPAAASPPEARRGGAAATDIAPDPAHRWVQALWLRPLIEQMDASVPRPECVKVLTAISSGSQLGPGEGWFGPSHLRYGWEWLKRRFDADKDGVITRKEFRGPAELFDRLDRDRDGVLTADDFDWSEKSPFFRQTAWMREWFYALDADSNGRVSRKEWEAFFNRLAKGKDHFTPDDVREVFQRPPPPKAAGKKPSGPPRDVLFWGLMKGELGSPFEGPRPGQPAPDFTLPTHNGKRKITLSQLRGKPVVLVFGNFT